MKHLNYCSLIIIPFLSSCVYGLETSSHNHEWEISSDSATCKQSGAKLLRCVSCGETREEYSPKKDHDWNVTVSVPATCTSNGVKTYKCKLCNTSRSETIYSSGHNVNSTGYCYYCGKFKYNITNNDFGTGTTLNTGIHVPYDVMVDLVCEKNGTRYSVNTTGISFIKYYMNNGNLCLDFTSKIYSIYMSSNPNMIGFYIDLSEVRLDDRGYYRYYQNIKSEKMYFECNRYTTYNHCFKVPESLLNTNLYYQFAIGQLCIYL